MCGADDECMGFTFESTIPQPTAAVQVYFKSVANFVSSNTWEAWVKTGPPAFPDVNFTVGGLKVGLRPTSHTVQIMGIESDPMPPYNFSWVPPLTAYGRNSDRSVPSCHQLGDVTMRFQPLSETNGSSWAMYTSAWAGGVHYSIPIPAPYPGVVQADDITPLLNSTPAEARIVPYPLSVRVTRTYETTGDVLLMKFNITALTDTRIGGFGMSMMADDSTDQALPLIAYTNSFADPHIGSHHGWAEWTRITGNQSMMVLPGTPATRMEAWRPLLEDCGFNGGMAEWTVISGGWASEWDTNRQAPVLDMPADLKGTGVWGPNPATPWPSWNGNRTLQLSGMSARYWNTPSFLEMHAGETVTYGLRFILSPGGPRTRDAVLSAAGEPVVNAVPGYVLGMDMNSSYLLVTPNGGRTVASVATVPAGILTASPSVTLADGTVRVPLQTLAIGRVRVSIVFSDASESVAHYRVIPPFRDQVAAVGQHWANDAWLPREFPDPFGRSASVMPYDREAQAHAIDDSRAYIVGLSDDAGAAQNLGFATKVSYAPTQAEMSRVDDYIQYTLYGVKPDTAMPPLRSLQGRPEDGADYEDRIRMTVYYYCQTPGNCTSANGHFPYVYPEQDKCDMPVGGPVWCMTEDMANATYRGFNWPHSTAVWYGLYRAARNYDRFTTLQPWAWYLERAWSLAMTLGSPNVGFMDGTVFRELLLALQAEGALNTTIQAWAEALQSNMMARADGWSTLLYPFGSEFNYDTTGQEEVYVWLKFFGFDKQAAATLDAVLGYMRNIPNWAWNGGARSMGDLGNNGLWFVNRGGERLLMHYRAGLNMIPILEGYRSNPDDSFLLAVAMGAIGGQLTNIDPTTGATSMGFHSFPFVLEHDPRSGDYGCGYFGHTTETGAVLVSDWRGPGGWACWQCNLWPGSVANTSVALTVVDSYHVRLYVEPLGMQLVAQAGTIQSATFDFASKTATLYFAPGSVDPAPYTSLRLEVRKEAVSRPGSGFSIADANGQAVPVVRGAFQIPPSSVGGVTSVTLSWTA